MLPPEKQGGIYKNGYLNLGKNKAHGNNYPCPLGNVLANFGPDQFEFNSHSRVTLNLTFYVGANSPPL